MGNTSINESLNFGHLLSRLRRDAGLTQEELAERAELSRRGIAALEGGERQVPQRATLNLLTEALGLEPDQQAMFEAAARRGRTAALATPGTTVTASLGLRTQPVPVPLSSMVGRLQELDSIRRLLTSEGCRLLTLLGPGGVGKTRLALEVARALTDDFDGRVYFVPLAALEDPSLVPSRIAATLGVVETAGQEICDQIIAALGPRSCLLILDNLEHVIASASAAATLLRQTTHLRIMATSRSVLRLAGEQVFDVPALPIPMADGLDGPEPRDYAAVALFAARASEVRMDFQLTDGNAGAVVDICRRLDGLPLAIELAAARVRLLTPEAILSRLGSDGASALPASDRRDLPDRHQTMRAVFDWSFSLLTPDERRLLRLVAVFRGGWELEAMENVIRRGGIAASAIDNLASLLDQSLVRTVDGNGFGVLRRYELLGTIREFALQQLKAEGEVDHVTQAHAEWVTELSQVSEDELLGPRQSDWLLRIDAEIDNVRAALDWSIEKEATATGLSIATRLWRYWYARGLLTEGRQWLVRLLEASERGGCDSQLVAKAMIWLAAMARDQGDYDLALDLSKRGRQLAVDAGDDLGRALALNVEGSVVHYQGDSSTAETLYEEGRSLYARAGYDWGVAMSLNNLAAAAWDRGDENQAMAMYEESLAITQRLGDLWTKAVVMDNLADLARHDRAYDRARSLALESLDLRRELGDPWGEAESLRTLADVAQAQGEPAQAIALYETSIAVYQRIGDRWRHAACLEGLAMTYASLGESERPVVLFAKAARVREEIGVPASTAAKVAIDAELARLNDALGETQFAELWKRSMLD